MIYSVAGKITLKKNTYVVVNSGGLGFKVFISLNTYKNLPEAGASVVLLTHFRVREDGMSLYGFLEEKELNFFEALLSVSGVGPKSALGVLNAAPVDRLAGAISKGETELLQRSYGIGKRTAERIVVELKDKIVFDGTKGEEAVRLIESDSDVYEALTSLGYSGKQAKEAIDKIDQKLKGVDERLRDALNKIKG